MKDMDSFILAGMTTADEKRARQREYMREWRAQKLAEDPQYYSRRCKEWRNENLEYARAKDRERGRTEERRARMRQYYADNRDRLMQHQRGYTAAHMDDMLAYNERRKATPEVRARKALYRAVKAGKITKPDRCDDCKEAKTPKQLHGHHEDYARQLDVLWLCARCHGKRHRAD